ncbi:MAG: hypothetical protein ACMG6E_00275 [Candidatus Roizmanbacteria bacterium]
MEEKKHLQTIIISTIHHSVIDLILSELPESQKKTFLLLLSDNNHDEIWILISAHVKEPEKKIKNTVESLRKDLLTDILALLSD